MASRRLPSLPCPPRAQVLITNGGNHTLEMVFALFCDRGDAILLEEYSYPVVTGAPARCCVGVCGCGGRRRGPRRGCSGAAPPRCGSRLPTPAPSAGPPGSGTESLAQPKGLHAVPVPIDAQGIIPERLAAVLAAARAAADAPGGPRFPKLLYTVPTGQNPTGEGWRVLVRAPARARPAWLQAAGTPAAGCRPLACKSTPGGPF